MAKLSKATVLEIRKELEETHRTQADIAKEFGVTTHTVSFINTGKTHKDKRLDYPIRKEARHPSQLKAVKVSKFLARAVNVQNELIYSNKTMKEISIEYGIDYSTISRMNTGERNYDAGLHYPLRVTSQMLGDKVRKDHSLGLSKVEIQNKYNLSIDKVYGYLRGVK